MLTPLKEKRRRLLLGAYDLEWKKATGEVTLAGLFVRNQYSPYKTVDAMLSAMLRPEFNGYYFFAHSGGRHDFTLVLPVLRKMGYKVLCQVAGSRVLLGIVTDGVNQWYFADSFAVLRGSLADIGEKLGLPKIEGDTDDMTYDELLDRNERDCEIVVRGLERFEDLLWEWGGELRHTVGATALRYFRRVHLQAPLHTSIIDNNFCRDAYHASRVEVFRNLLSGSGSVRDINSAFPYMMLNGLPGRLKKVSKRISDGCDFWIADVEVSVPDMYVPPLPLRHNGRIYFPTGAFRTRITKPEYELLLEAGGDITKVYEVHEYEIGLLECAAYVKKIYDMRAVATNEYERLVLKYLLNTLYGKLAEHTRKHGIVVNPDILPPIEMAIAPGIYRTIESVAVPHAHVAAACWITALVRCYLTRELWRYDHNLLGYCDTDSIHGIAYADLLDSNELGGWKIEESFHTGEWVSPKLYALHLHRTPKKGTEPYKIRAKGFRKLNYADFCKVRDGHKVELDMMRSPLTAHKTDIIYAMKKGLRLQCPVCYRHVDGPCPTHYVAEPTIAVSGKRCAVGDITRPWNVSELKNIS